MTTAHAAGPEERPIPAPDGQTGRRVLRALASGGVLGALRAVRAQLGPIFRLPLPGFDSIFVSGPQANRTILVSARDKLAWRIEGDPVTRLLRHGLLVEDGQAHDALRQAISPALHRAAVDRHVESMWRAADRVTSVWPASGTVDMLPQMRRITLLILVETLFGIDFGPDLDRLWPHILRLLSYISPGAWVLWPGLPRLGYRRARREVDAYLFRIIQERRSSPIGDDLLGHLVRDPALTDDLIRDQMLTMLIAGHDTSTALLAWALYLLGAHPETMARLQVEVDSRLDRQPPAAERLASLHSLESVLRETLRLFPSIHLGNRQVRQEFSLAGYSLKRGQRLLYSIYLTHRDPDLWPEPDRFDPSRFEGGPISPYVYLPFGGGPRNCIGAHFGLIEAKVVLARLLQTWIMTGTGRVVHEHMGATLEPRPGVVMRVQRRDQS
jgi:cytochrome P450